MTIAHHAAYAANAAHPSLPSRPLLPPTIFPLLVTLLKLSQVTKRYPGVTALDEVDFALHAGTVHALVGENGAGKSTLLRIIGGATSPNAGGIRLRDESVTFRSPRDALGRGITVIHQEMALVPHLGADANVFLGMEHSSWGTLAKATMREQAGSALESLGFDRDPSTPVERLSVAQQQLVEIARALVRETDVIAFDEPTATLTPHEADHLFAQIDILRSNGVGVIFVSHRLDEVRRIADVVTVLRDGRQVRTGTAQSVTDAELIRAMVGRDVEYQRLNAAGPPEGKPFVEVRSLTRDPRFRDVSFEIRRGEIVGLAGLVGSGRTEVARALAGIDQWDCGQVVLNGSNYKPRSPREAIDRGVVYSSEDRKRDGLVMSMLVRENVTLPVLNRFSSRGVINRRDEAGAATEVAEDVELRPPNIERSVATLSGGNQQKVVFAKSMLANADVLLLDEPTRGVDVGAKVELHKQIRALADRGKAVLVISSELPEILALSDRVVVLRDGHVAGCLAADELSGETIMALAVAAA